MAHAPCDTQAGPVALTPAPVPPRLVRWPQQRRQTTRLTIAIALISPWLRATPINGTLVMEWAGMKRGYCGGAAVLRDAIVEVSVLVAARQKVDGLEGLSAEVDAIISAMKCG